jgi:hypothetical protein
MANTHEYGSPEAITAHKKARAALEENSHKERAAGIYEETERFRQLNHAVIDAEKLVPKWRRG